MNDQINAGFELAGALLMFLNARQVWQDKGHAGIFIPTIAFLTSRVIWRVYYYAELNQWWSVLGGGSMVVAYVSWLSLILWFGKKNESR